MAQHSSLNQHDPILAAWNPAHDENLFHTYSIRDLAEKKKNKEGFQKLIGLNTLPKSLLVAVIPHFSHGAGLQHIEHIAPGLMECGAQLVIVDSSQYQYSNSLSASIKQHRGYGALIPENERMLHRGLAASDLLLIPGSSHPSGVPQKIAFRYGTVPVASLNDTADDMLVDYDPRTEAGNSFLYIPDSPWSMFAAIVRAIETYKLIYDWRGIQKNGMELTGAELPLNDDDSLSETEVL